MVSVNYFLKFDLFPSLKIYNSMKSGNLSMESPSIEKHFLQTSTMKCSLYKFNHN